MEGAKEIARDMLDAINVASHGFFGAVAKGFISFPVSFGYLGYDFMDAGHRSENFDDKMRIAKLVKSGTSSEKLIHAALSVFIDDFTSRINIEKLTEALKKILGSLAGKFAFTEITGFNIGSAITSRGLAGILAGGAVGTFIAIGAETSRAIYTSRYLRERNPSIYYKLKKMGDLDLLYFLIEDTVKPFEKACEVDNKNPAEFNKICEYFFGGMAQ